MSKNTFSEAAETVLADTRTAMKPNEIWAEITRRGLVDSTGQTPEATLYTDLMRKSINWRDEGDVTQPRFYRRGDGAIGLWNHLAREQQRAMAAALEQPAKVSARQLEELEAMRGQSDFAKRVLETLVPDEAVRRSIGALIGTLLQEAHALHPGSWRIIVEPTDWRFVIGRVRIVKVTRGSISFLGKIEADGVSESARAALREVSTVRRKRAPAELPGFAYRALRSDLLPDLLEGVIAAIRPGLAGAVKTVRGKPRTHAPDAVVYLSQLLGIELPQPTYSSIAGPDDHDEDADEEAELEDRNLTLDELLSEYVRDYLSTQEVKQFLASYETERVAARANLERIDAIEQRGEDPTDAILLGLLPHTDSANHRSRGAWISHAPAVQGDVRKWFEGSKWVQPQDWPRVAKLILDFVRNSIAKPGDVAEQIRTFDSNALSKGFGVGMLTPILNALAPDHFPISNSKAVKIVSYFGEVEIEATLEDYPAMITQWRKLLQQQTPLRDLAIGVRADDALDHFCHWLIAVRKFSFPEIDRTLPPEPGPDGSQTKPSTTPPPLLPPYTIEDALQHVFLSRDELIRLMDLLAYKKNLVLQGPPGVGKTFVADQLAYLVLGAKDSSRLKRVQFHQSYAYEDFVRGYRPKESGGFDYRDGPMFEFCEHARRDPRAHVMIIDEINRGNLSKILGELMLLVESDKRDEKWAVELAYAKPGEKPFWVPPNVHIIGTMNTADRSLALVDYALRRRFAFASLLPAFGPQLRKYLEARSVAPDMIDKLFARVAKLNDVIERDTRNLGRGYLVGHSYFCQQDPTSEYGIDWYERIVRYEIKPLLEEYFAEDPDKIEKLAADLLS